MALLNIIIYIILTGCVTNNQVLVNVPPYAVVIDGIVHQADEQSLRSGSMMLNGKQYQLGQVYRNDQPLYSLTNQNQTPGTIANSAITTSNPVSWITATLQLIASILISIRSFF